MDKSNGVNNNLLIKNRSNWLHIALLITAVFIAYFKILYAGFICWDDADYVMHNKDITKCNFSSLTVWFSHFYIGNYHPLTLLSYAIDHAIGGTQPFIYHFTNLLLHICTSVIVYFLINRLQPNNMVGFFVALIFAVHPAQTESVSWIAERKTVLCGLFYFLTLYKYTHYLEKPSARALTIVFLISLCAMLSKGIAVAMPFSLLAIDLWAKRDLASKKIWLEKITFLLISVVIGMVAIKAQQSGKFLGLHPHIGWFKTVLFAAYAYVQYIIHLPIPLKLSVIYPYPDVAGFIEYLYLILSIGIIALAFIAYRKKWYILSLGITFYTVNIMFLLQFVQFGEVLMADRYLYIAGIGIFFPAVYYSFIWLQKWSTRLIAVAAISTVTVVFLLITFARNDIWLSDFNFFSSILEAYPNSAVAQYSMGVQYMRQGEYADAEQHLNKAVEIDPGNYKAWYDKGNLYLREHKAPECLDALNKCLALKEYPKAYLSRALLYQNTGKQELALADVEKVLAEDTQNARAYFIKADCMEQLGRGDEAIDIYSKAIQYDCKDPKFFIRRGLLYGKTKQNNAALRDLNTAVQLNPDDGEALYFRGIIKYHSGEDPCADFVEALHHGYQQAGEAISRACGTNN